MYNILNDIGADQSVKVYTAIIIFLEKTMSEEYVAGKFYQKYYLGTDLNAKSIIENEHSWGVSIIKEYNRTVKKIQKNYEKEGEQNNRIDAYFESSDSLDYFITTIEKNPKDFSNNLSELNESERFFRYVMEFDKRNKEYQEKLEEHKEAVKKENIAISYALVVGVLLGVLFHQLITFF